MQQESRTLSTTTVTKQLVGRSLADPPIAADRVDEQKHRQTQKQMKGRLLSNEIVPCNGPDLVTSPIENFVDYKDRNEEIKTQGARSLNNDSSKQVYTPNCIGGEQLVQTVSKGKKSSSSSAATLKVTHYQPKLQGLLGTDNQFIEFEQDEIVINTGGKSTQTKKIQDFGDLKSFKNAQKSIKGKNDGFERKQQTSSSKKQGVTQQNVQNLINAEGPIIVGPDLQLGGTIVAKTNPTSMRDKIKMDNPGKKILTPRGGQKLSLSVHNSGMHTNANKLQQKLHQDIDAYSSEQVSVRGSGGGTGPNSIKHQESISAASGSVIAAKNKGKKYMLTSTFSEIERNNIGIATTVSKIINAGSKNTAVHGVGGSIDLQGSTAPMTLMKSKSIHGAKVSEVTVQANHVKNQQASFNSTMSSKQFATVAKSGSLLSAMVSTPQKFRVKNEGAHSVKKGSIIKSEAQISIGEKQNKIQQNREHETQDTKRVHGKSQTSSGSILVFQGLGVHHLLSKVISEKKLTATMAASTPSEVSRLSPRDTVHDSTSKAGGIRLLSTGKKSHGSSQKGTLSIQVGQQNYMNEYLAKSSNNMKQLQQVSAAQREPTQLMPLNIIEPLPNFKNGAATVTHQKTLKQNNKVQDMHSKKPSQASMGENRIQAQSNASTDYPVSAKQNARGRRAEGSHGMASGEESLKKGGSIDTPLKHAGVYNRSELEQSILHNQSQVTDQITSGGHRIKNHAEKNLFYKVQDSTLNQDQTDHEIEYLDEQELSHAKNNDLNRPNYGVDDVLANLGEAECDDEFDGTPLTAVVDDFNVIQSKPCSPTDQVDERSEREGTELEDMETYAIEHRNDEKNPLNLNSIAGQKTEHSDRKNAKLFKKKLDRGLHIKSLFNPSEQSETDTLIYNARSGGPNQNFNFAKNNQNQSRPTSTKHGQGPKSMSCWIGPIAQAANYTSSKQVAPDTTKNSLARGNTFNNSFQKNVGSVGNQQTNLKSNSAQKSVSVSKMTGPSSHKKNASQASKEVFKGSGNITKKTVKNLLPPETTQKPTSSSFETRPGSQSMSYIPPRQIQDQTLQLIQVPLSRAELNKQSAYHLADAQYGGGTSSHHHKSISYSKDDVCAFNRSMQKKSTPSKLTKQRIVYQTITNVPSLSMSMKQQTLIGSPNKMPGTSAPGATAAEANAFSRSLSNQQIVIFQANNTAAKRQTNSQSRGRTRDSSGQPKQKTAQKGTQQQQLTGFAGEAPPKNKISVLTGKTSYQTSKMSKKNKNNLKMQTMQLRDQDFKKITSQIQSQTITNAKKKKLQFVNTQPQKPFAVGGQSHAQQHPSSLNKRQGSISHDSMDLNSKFMKTTKIYSPHRRSIQQVSNPNMAVYLNPIDAGGDLGLDNGSLGNTGNNYTGQRKFAYSLTDKYKGGFEELVWKQPGIYSGSHVSSSDGGASYMIPSENERIVETSNQQKNKVSSKNKTSKRLEKIAVSQGNQPVSQFQSSNNNNVNTFFPDPNATFFERKKSSLERTTAHPTVSQQHIASSRGSSKHIEPHRLVKVSKPFAGNTFNLNKMSEKVLHGDAHKKVVLTQAQMAKPHEAQTCGQMPENESQQKKGGSFVGSYKEPQPKSQSKGDKFPASIVPSVSQMDSGCQSPEQPSRKQVHLNSHGPGSLIANANLSSNNQSIQSTNLIRQIETQQALSTKQVIAGNVLGSVKQSVSHQTNSQQKSSTTAQTKNKLIQIQTASYKSPQKKVNRKLSQKLQAAGYTVELSTATRKVLTGGANSAVSSSIQVIPPFKDHVSDQVVFKAQHKLAAPYQSQQHLTRISSGTAPTGISSAITPMNIQSTTAPISLEIHKQQSSDRQKSENIQLLRQVHHKQITTASKGKDSGSVQKPFGATQGKSVTVLVPSAESVALSKAIFLEQQVQPVKLQKNTLTKKSQDSFANSAEKERRLGGSLIIQNEKAAKSEKLTPTMRSEKQIVTKTTFVAQPPIKAFVNVDAESSEGQPSANGDQTMPDQQPSSKKTSFISQKQYNNQKALNVIEERLESQESAISDPNLSPRTRHILKIQKKIKFAFLKTGSPPDTQTENYKIGKVMGKGAFGKVNLAIHRLANKFVALKSINKQFLTQEQSKRKVMQEFNILRRTRHCNIVRLYESFETNQHIVFVMEVCGGGDLLTYVRRRRKLKEDIARFLFRQIITGLAYCHTKNVLHRDIKLDNILLTSQGDVKICDFGVSKLVTPGETMTEQCGTPAYIAPEVFKNKGYKGFASDIWSAGVVLYAMLFGAVPFKASNMAELHKQVLERQPTYKEEEISKDALALLKGILEKDPNLRLTSEQIFAHKWMAVPQKKQVHVFSETEKEGIIAEFEYYNKRERDVIIDGEHQVVPTDPFAEQMLVSTQNSELKNVSTRSIILAPFNSTRSQLVYNEEERKLMQMMFAPRTAVKFSAKVKEIDRQYELNNNADLDNGVYHQDDEEEAKDETTPGSNPPRPTEERPETRTKTRGVEENSIADSFNQEQLQSQLDELDEANNSINSAELDEGDKNYVSPVTHMEDFNTDRGRKKLSEWRQLEKQMIKGDINDQNSAPKQSVLSQYFLEEIKGDKACPESGDLGQDMLEQSYEQVKIELYSDDELSPGSGLNFGENVNQNITYAVMGQTNQQRLTMVIDEASVTEIEKCGYPKPYIMSSLNSDDMNHVTTFYYLLQTQKEY